MLRYIPTSTRQAVKDEYAAGSSMAALSRKYKLNWSQIQRVLFEPLVPKRRVLKMSRLPAEISNGTTLADYVLSTDLYKEYDDRYNARSTQYGDSGDDQLKANSPIYEAIADGFKQRWIYPDREYTVETL
jgi:hypothetical protein